MNSSGQRIGFWLFLLSGGLLVYGFDPETDGMDGIKDLVRKRFPEVQQLQPEALDQWLKDAEREKPVILDVREAEEFEVSHLKGARRVDPEAKEKEVEAVLAPNRPVVVYCSVGYRSSALARRLMQHGITNVFNLEGSIFQWANEGRTLVQGADDQPAETVHPFNKRWGVLLKPEARDDSKK